MNRNETWGPGGSEAGPPIDVQIVPIPPDEIEAAQRRERLGRFRGRSQTPAVVAEAVSDLIRHLGLDV